MVMERAACRYVGFGNGSISFSLQGDQGKLYKHSAPASDSQAFGVTTASDQRQTTVDDQRIATVDDYRVMREKLIPQKHIHLNSQIISKISTPSRDIPSDRPRRKLPYYELRIQESFEETDREEGREELALIITDREVRVLSSKETQELHRQVSEGVQTLIFQHQTPEGSREIHTLGNKPCRPHLSHNPLVLLFKEPLQVKEAYRHLDELLEEEEGEQVDPQAGSQVYPQSQMGRPVPKPRMVKTQSICKSLTPRIQLPKEQLASLREALRLGLQTGHRNLQLSFCAERDTSVSPHREDSCKLNALHPEVCTVTPNRSPGPQPSQALGDRPKGASSEDACTSTYSRLDSLEETIRELESTLQEISAHPPTGYLFPRDFLGQLGTDSKREPCEAGQVTDSPPPLYRTTDSDTTTTLAKKKPPVPPKPSAVPLHLTKVHSSCMPVPVPLYSTDLGLSFLLIFETVQRLTPFPFPFLLQISNNSSGSGKVPHTSAASRLKHLQQSSPEKSKMGKQREDFLKIQGQQQPAPNTMLVSQIFTYCANDN
ncbi:hypothetical protein JZ751_026520 [Albula glossodonta]|uniref:Uncharacterized protein n=1 Tax=Albula glossodonta TaxID=121402 RepID=A0A8T2PLQ8_9TELE|nr:hypothetical protein JZ751_026520 [Albula glossodonta]